MELIRAAMVAGERHLDRSDADGRNAGTRVIAGPWGGTREFDGIDDRIAITAIQIALQGSTTFALEMISHSLTAMNAPGFVSHDCSNCYYLLPSGSHLQANLKATGYSAGLCPWYSGVFTAEDGVLLDTRPVAGTSAVLCPAARTSVTAPTGESTTQVRSTRCA